MSTAFDALLELQAQDTQIDQLRHQLAALPARAERDAAVAAAAATAAELAEVTITRDGLARDQKRLDDEVETLGAKRKGFDTKLYSGTVTNHRELQDLQDEIEALGRRISVLEDHEIEIMEQVEPVEARLAELTTERDQRDAAATDAEHRLTAAEAELAVALDEATSSREAKAAPIPAPLLQEYDRLRVGLGGVGVARLVGSQCGGCHLTLSAMEASRLRRLPDDEIAHCEECGRILVP